MLIEGGSVNLSRSDKRTEGFIKRNERLISLSLIAAVILVWSAIFLLEPQPIPGRVHSLESYEGCHIEYGISECINGSLVTSFYNPGTEDLTMVSMHFRDGEDVDTYNCNEILESETAGTLTTVTCTSDINISNVRLVWCCGDNCSETYMKEPSDDLTLIY